MEVEFIKNQNAIAEKYGISRLTASRRIKSGEIKVIEVPKGHKYLILNKNKDDL